MGPGLGAAHISAASPLVCALVTRQEDIGFNEVGISTSRGFI
jgi:hypothetical protein